MNKPVKELYMKTLCGIMFALLSLNVLAGETNEVIKIPICEVMQVIGTNSFLACFTSYDEWNEVHGIDTKEIIDREVLGFEAEYDGVFRYTNSIYGALVSVKSWKYKGKLTSTNKHSRFYKNPRNP